MARIKECIICGETKKVTDILKHKNKILNDNFVICKDCANKLFDSKDESVIASLLQLMNQPYVENIVKEKILDNGGISGYLKRIAPFKKYQTYNDSDFQNSNIDDLNNFKITPEIIEKWGADYDKKDYYSFEMSLKRLVNIKKPNTQFELMRYITNVQLEQSLKNALKEGDTKSITSLRKSYSDDLKEIGLDQVLNSDDQNGLNLGQRIHNWENNEPVPEMKELDDIAHVKDYINKWFVIPMKRVFGRATEEEVAMLYDDSEK